MKDKNKIFFGEKGISSTSANHLANIAKQMVDQENAKLDANCSVNTAVCVKNAGPIADVAIKNTEPNNNLL